MNKLKSLLIFLLTAILLITGAFLPNITAAMADQVRNGKVNTAPIQSVQLEFGSEKPTDSMIRKLAIRSRMNTLPIAPGDASMTEEEVFAAAESCMEQYISAGIFSWFEETHRMAEPHLAINPYNTDEFYIFWAVNFVGENDPYSNLFLHLDDETGRILYIDYVTYDPDRAYLSKEQSQVIDAFSQLYFDQLDLMEAADPTSSKTVTVTKEMSKDVWCRRYSFTDTGYGAFTLEFYVKPKGFYLLFPD